VGMAQGFVRCCDDTDSPNRDQLCGPNIAFPDLKRVVLFTYVAPPPLV
jgi:hypothetical protein